MTRTDASITVTCDGEGCDMDIQLILAATAQRSWDERHVDAELRREGWVVANGRDYCPDCIQVEPSASFPDADGARRRMECAGCEAPQACAWIRDCAKWSREGEQGAQP